MNLNDNRSLIELKDVFDKDGKCNPGILGRIGKTCP